MVIVLEQKIIDELDTIRHVNNLAFDRSAATVGETRAVNYLQEELFDNTINFKLEYFAWSSPIRFLMKTIYLMILAYLLAYKLLLVIVLFFFIKYLFQKTRKISFTQKEQSKNLITTIKARRRVKNRPVIIFSAHYDSVSSRISYKVQNALLFIIKIIILPYIGLTIFVSIWLVLDLGNLLNLFSITEYNVIFIYLVSIISIISLSVVIPTFLFFFITNKSSGSIDNASGVSILIELAKLIKNKALENYDIIFVWCGAEEWGLKGSKNYIKKNKDYLKNKYDLDRSMNINIDMVGTYIGLFNKKGLIRKKALNKNLNKTIQQSARKLNIPLEVYNKVRKPAGDYLKFQRFGKRTKSSFQVACFHSDKDSKYIHSTKDTPDKCSNKILNGCLGICYETISHLDSQIE
ncbi:MAG: M28 family metallopeptidase [Candidatus Odinarchaeota archaeon]